MNPDPTINVDSFISVVLFLLVVSVWCIGVFLWLGRYLFKLEGVRRRLGLTSEASKDSETLRLWRDLQIEQTPRETTEKETFTLAERVNHWISDAGWKVPFRAVVFGVLGAAVFAFIIIYNLLGGVWLGACGVLATIYIFLQYTQNRILKRANLFERQLVDSLGIAGRALRAGHPLIGAFQLIAEEISDPVGVIFRQIVQEQAFGSDLKGSLKKAAKETRNTEFKLFSTAVTVQVQSGGNLADLMDSLSSVIRSRIWLNKRIRVLTAQTQFSKIVLISMPIFLFFLLNAMNREYMEPLYTTRTGNFLLVLMFVMIMLGSWMMNKLAKIKY
ncbi:MAG: type II secretion system F family protein [Phycisphaerae bacterium]|nr:type II secretion system F family protein [Phycisphaerae bacterium]